MDAPAGFCALCGEPSDHAHHLTGRDPNGDQLHDEIVVDLCFDHHIYVHEVLRRAGVDTPPTAWSRLACVEYVLGRIAAFIGRYAERADNPIWGPIARLLEWCAREIGGRPTPLLGVWA